MSDDHDEEVPNEENVRFILEKSVRYGTKGGDSEQGSWIELRPPSPIHLRECGALKQAWLRAFNEINKDDDDDDKVQVEGNTKGPDPMGIVNVMATASSVDYPDVLEVARKLFISGVAWVEGEVKVTNNIMQRMTLNDLERMLGVYLINFTLASSLQQTEKPSSNN